MKKILYLIASPRKAASFSTNLGNAIVEKLKEANPGATVEEVNLVETNYPHINESHLQGFFAPAGQLTDEDKAATRMSDAAISQLNAADFIVIGAPFYNFSIPSALKAWIDQVVRAGITFHYTEHGPEGLVKDKKVYIAMASGGVYSEGPYQSNDFSSPYLKCIFGFLGMKDVKVFRAEGTSVPGLKEHALEKAIESITL